ncbi:sulfotransferase [Actinoplanes ianthinogenes]|uniref:Sulfotransferase n=1 Tax=Actinoplanes ianthinogenes TaxID=122358 RepID=A0ABN6C443_9ACTN|nr:sulfotransferase domain-containing protein [Actinoplanes ianthinogenes]BCJ39363.1 sulfotransferase [Actinoplanes ianthinogenes]GGR36623.1 sulfotransferase [Actinoplanes ianthinogenes]
MGNASPVVYRSGLNDSSRWQGFPLRAGDIVISAPSKCGTTWLQMICALLIFRTPDLPGPLTSLSPWLDMCLRPIGEVTRTLTAQRHRRFIKTHTPLDGLPWRPDVTYLVVGRDPRDVAVSMHHHRRNLDDEVIHRLLPGSGSAPSRPAGSRERVLQWISDSLPGLVHHLGQAWERRDDPAVVLVHHADLSRDLDGEMRRIAGRLGIEIPEEAWPGLVAAAGFEAMRARAGELAPDEQLGLFTSKSAFFRSGRAGEWRDLLTGEDEAAYDRLLRSLATAEFVEWLHRSPSNTTVNDRSSTDSV